MEESTSLDQVQLSHVGQELAIEFMARCARDAQRDTELSKSERTEATALLANRLYTHPQAFFAFLWSISVGVEHANKANQTLQAAYKSLQEAHNNLGQESLKVIDWARAAGMVGPPPKVTQTVEFLEDAEGNITGARVLA